MSVYGMSMLLFSSMFWVYTHSVQLILSDNATQTVHFVSVCVLKITCSLLLTIVTLHKMYVFVCASSQICMHTVYLCIAYTECSQYAYCVCAVQYASVKQLLCVCICYAPWVHHIHTLCVLYTGLHKLWYPSIRDTGTWSKFGAHGEHGDVFLVSNRHGICPKIYTAGFSG